MVVQTADEVIGNAKSWSSCDVGMCLWTCQEWYESPHAYPDASTQWREAEHKHTDDDPPAGAPVFWTGGGHGYGHIAVSLGGSRIRSTDCTSNGDVSDCDLSWPRTHWGLTYAGWTEDIGGVDLPFLTGSGEPDNPNGVTAGDVVLVTAAGTLNGRDAPAGEVIGSKAHGDSFTVAEVVDGWAREATP